MSQVLYSSSSTQSFQCSFFTLNWIKIRTEKEPWKRPASFSGSIHPFSPHFMRHPGYAQCLKIVKMSHLNFSILAFPIKFCLIKSDLSGNTVWLQASGFQKLAQKDHFWHFWSTFVHLNVNVARFARNVECHFFSDFQTPCVVCSEMGWTWIHFYKDRRQTWDYLKAGKIMDIS